MEWRLRLIIGAAHLAAFSLLRLQFHRGLKAVDIQAQRSIQLGELPIGEFPDEAIIADHLTHDLSIFLLYVTLIITVLRTPSRKGDVFLLTVGRQFNIDELSSIVGVNAQEGKRKQCAVLVSVRHMTAS